jgi:hypothetical protein
MSADWVTISSLATAGGTLILAVATFASVRSGNRTARAAERSLLAGLRPLIVPSYMTDAPIKVGFNDGRWLRIEGGRGAAELGDDVIYLAASLRNVGNGIALLHGWHFGGELRTGGFEQPEVEHFRRLSRDIYVPSGDVSFWQGALRDPSEPEYDEVQRLVKERLGFVISILYGDYEGGQRMITRLGFTPAGEDAWIVSAGRHWHLDREDPR